MRLACSGGACGHVHACIGGACVACIACIVEHALVCIVAFCGVALCYVFLCVDVAVFCFVFVVVWSLCARCTTHALHVALCMHDRHQDAGIIHGAPHPTVSLVYVYTKRERERERYYRTS